MQLLNDIANNIGFGSLLALLRAGRVDFQSLASIEALILSVFPTLLVVEVVFLWVVYRKRRSVVSGAYKLPALVFLLNTGVGLLVNLDVFVATHRFAAEHAPFTLPMTVGSFLYSFLVWELTHFLYHWSAHKVRLLWCLHSPHHAPTHMNLSVIHVSFLLQGAYATLIRVGLCTLLGVPLDLLVLCVVIDACWGSLIHVSEEAWRAGRLPRAISWAFLAPVHHRVHHASNAEYIDRNYCNTLAIWDRLFGTFKEPISGIDIRYGLVRPVRPGSIGDLYFGEFAALCHDMRTSPGWREAVQLPFRPPGWSPRQGHEGAGSAIATKTARHR